MSTSPVDPRKAPRVDNDKVDPPRGAYKRSSKDCLPVAIPDYTLEANAAALLVSEEDFDSAIAHTITSSRILTAWVAFQMAHIDAEGGRTISEWRVIDDIIANRFQLWDAQYRSNSELYLSPVDLVRMKPSELNALAVFVLCRRIQDNTRGTNELSSSLTYHTYYRTSMSRMYLAAHILSFLRYYTKPSSTFSTHRPKDTSLVPTWLRTQGACVGQACQKFADVWDPCTLLDDEYQGQAHHNTPTCRTSQDDPQHKRNPCVPDKRNAHGDSKTVLLYFEREDIFELDTSVLPRVSSDGVSLSDAILGCLAWLKISCPSSIALHPEGTLAPGDSVQTLTALWEIIDSQELPAFRLQSFLPTPGLAANTCSSQPILQQMYTSHQTLALEVLIDELPDNDAQIARLLFELIKKGHSRSHEHIKDVEAMFASVKQRNAQEWERTDRMKTIFDEVARDKSQVPKLADLVDHLDDDHADDAHAMLHVLRRNLKGGRGFVGELSKLFQPVKQRNAEAWKRVSRVKKIFDELEQVSHLSGGTFAHASRRESRGSMLGTGKRKRME